MTPDQAQQMIDLLKLISDLLRLLFRVSEFVLFLLTVHVTVGLTKR